MECSVKSHKGMVREINEDYYSSITESPVFNAAFIIADGMGGHSAGEVASKMAVEYINEKMKENGESLSKGKIKEFIANVIHESNKIIYEKSSVPGPCAGMGTTLAIAIFLLDKLYMGHVGDSRIYIMRDGQIKQLTTDHSYVEELIKNGSLLRTEADKHPKKNIITRAIGCFEDIEADISVYDMLENDVFMLCTDGLTNMLTDEEILTVVNENHDPDIACDKLIDLANIKGGKDNITVAIIRT